MPSLCPASARRRLATILARVVFPEPGMPATPMTACVLELHLQTFVKVFECWKLLSERVSKNG